MPNQNSNPVTAEELAEIRRLHAAGKGRNEISRITGRSLRTISVHAAKMNLTFDREATRAATEARMADLEEKRVILADALTDDALRLSSQVWEPAIVFAFGGKENEYNERPVDEPPAQDKKALITAATAASAQSLRLVPAKDDSDTEAARSMLGALADGIRRVTRSPGEDTAEEG